MLKYIENPKTRGSGIICAIPQTGHCPNECEDCFFQSGRSYLEPLEHNLPNIPPADMAKGRIVRVNDGHDSNIRRGLVIEYTKHFPDKFYNTAIPKSLEKFPAPVVLTLNPGKMTDSNFHKLDTIPNNLMFVRFRTNTWNLGLADEAVGYYGDRKVPIILTFMAYFKTSSTIKNPQDYTFRSRTLNPYWAITTEAWERVMDRYKRNKWVYSCGKIEGEMGISLCRHCGNCLREYFATKERMLGRTFRVSP